MTQPDPVVDALAGANVAAITARLCEVEAHLAVIGQLGATLRAALLDRAVTRWREDGAAPTFRAPGLGSVSLSVPATKVVVTDQARFAEWVGENHPTEITTHLVVGPLPPANVLEVYRQVMGLLVAAKLGDAAVRVDTAVAPAFAKRLLERDVVVDPDGKGAIDTTLGLPVDGVTIVPGADPANPDGPQQPRSISVRLEAQAKADAIAQAEARLPQILEHGIAAAASADGTSLAVDDHPADDVAGEPDDNDLPGCACGHIEAAHAGKAHRGGCADCDCTRRRKPDEVPAVGWSS